MPDSALQLIHSDTAEKWQQILADLITEPKELLEILALDPAQNPLGEEGLSSFALKVPRPFVARMQKGNWQDPLLRQVWPDRLEAVRDPALVQDPLQESRFNPAPGLLQKYQRRVLLTAAPHCAIHCRYCFRRHFDYAANTPGRAQWQQALSGIRADATLREVILSGGDPLAAGDRYLAWLIDELGSIPQLTTLRIHTRLPIVIPQRISSHLLSILSNTRLKVVVIVHSNHAQELDSDVTTAIGKLAAIGCTLLNQSVLLADVNDNVDTLCELSDGLFAAAVLPYYLHLPDQVAGTAHFQVRLQQASELVLAMRARMPGYLVPRLVREDPGEDAKTLLL